MTNTYPSCYIHREFGFHKSERGSWLVQDVDECGLQEGLWLITVLWLALCVYP